MLKIEKTLLSLGVVVKNPDGFHHWIKWHENIADEILVYDHDSNPIIKIDHPKVKLYHHKDFQIQRDTSIQHNINFFLKNQMKGEFCSIIDDDEFLMGDVIQFLKNLPTKWSGVRLCNKTFGPHGQAKTPEESPWKFYKFYSSHCKLTKGIYRTDLITWTNTHWMFCDGDVCNTRLEKVNNDSHHIVGFEENCYDNIWYNHYKIKSLDDAMRKHKRGRISAAYKIIPTDYSNWYALGEYKDMVELFKMCYPNGVCYIDDNGKLVNYKLNP